jgi:hypothetical protein
MLLELEHKKVELEHKKVELERQRLLTLERLHEKQLLSPSAFEEATASFLTSVAGKESMRLSPGGPGTDSPPALASPADYSGSALSVTSVVDSGDGRYAPRNDNKDYAAENLPPADLLENQALRVRREFSYLTKRALLHRAELCGANPREIQLAADQNAIIDIIIRKMEALRLELSCLTLMEIQQQAQLLGVPEHEIEDAAEGPNVKDALTWLVARADQRGLRAAPTQRNNRHVDVSQPGSALDQILVRLKSEPADVKDGWGERQSALVQQPSPKTHAIAISPTRNLAKIGHFEATPYATNRTNAQDAQQASSLSLHQPHNVKMLTPSALKDPKSSADFHKQLMQGSTFVELQERVHKLGVDENGQRPPPPLPSRHFAPDHDLRPGSPQHRIAHSLAEPEPAPDPTLGLLRPEVYNPVHGTAEPTRPPTPTTAAAEEAHAAAKMQAIWRGKAGLKKAAEQKQATLVGSERIVASKRAIRRSQIRVRLLVLLTTVVSTLLPTYLIGAVYGAVANGEGIDGGIALNIGLRVGLFFSLVKHLQIEVFAAALRETTFVPGATERVVRPLLTAVGGFLFYAANWRFVDLENPDADIAFVKGVLGAVGYIVGTVLFFDVMANPVELWRLYRARNLLLPPAHAATWWKVTAVAGRGTLATALSLSTL